MGNTTPISCRRNQRLPRSTLGKHRGIHLGVSPHSPLASVSIEGVIPRGIHRIQSLNFLGVEVLRILSVRKHDLVHERVWARGTSTTSASTARADRPIPGSVF